MTYDLKNVFYLGFNHEWAGGTAASKQSVQPIDVSAYVDPIAKGRARGQGLAVYKVHHTLSTSTGGPILPGETAAMTMFLTVKPFSNTGDVLTGQFSDGDWQASSDLNIQTDQFQGGGETSLVANMATGGKLIPGLEPSTKVPYVVVRDTVFACMINTKAIAADINSGYRLECAPIRLDTATLNQLLRTQTA